MHRGLGEGVRDFRQKIFFPKNGVRGSLGSHWEVFHHGTPRNHFQGVVVAFGGPPGGAKEIKLEKKSISFFALKTSNMCSELMKN